jgi:hypothetical protein
MIEEGRLIMPMPRENIIHRFEYFTGEGYVDAEYVEIDRFGEAWIRNSADVYTKPITGKNYLKVEAYNDVTLHIGVNDKFPQPPHAMSIHRKVDHITNDT